MASLTSQPINTTYSGLLKTNDNAVLGVGTPSVITDGQGNASALSLAQEKVILEAGTQRIEVNTTQTWVKGSTVLIQDDTATNFVTTDATTSNIGNATNYLTIDATDASFVGAVDFSTATVTGLPADTNTTYDLAATQDGSNVDITLTGSDASVDTVQLTAGTNITLTETAGNITIDAAGGAAGLVSGAGSESMKSADTLTTVPANAGTVYSIAIGSGASVNAGAGNEGIAIGKNATTGTGVTIGPNAIGAGFGASVVVGRNANGNANEATALGWQTTSSGAKSITVGSNATASGEGSISIGRSANSTQIGAVAIGESVTATYPNTVSLKALELQTDSTPIDGGILMSDAGGFNRRINIDATGTLQIDSTPVGGGGAPTIDGTNIVTAVQMPGAPKYYRSTYSTNNNTYQGFVVGSNIIAAGAVTLAEGQLIKQVLINVKAASAGGAQMIKLGLYKSTYDINGDLAIGALEKSFGFTFSNSTGVKTVNTNHTLGATEDNIYFYAIYASDSFEMMAVPQASSVSNMQFLNISSQFNPARMGAFTTTEPFISGNLPADLTTGYTWAHSFAYPIMLFA